ncbi:MAG: Glu-tRNA(Gln) amidotransferase subunit GatE [Elusimicrobiota bacterium]
MRYTGLADTSPGVYRKLGLISGLEIHQQLLTAKKLFCRCPAGEYSHDWDAEILRHMRPTLSELGEYDGTALMEFKTKKQITYHINNATVCTYEFDDTPPFQANEEALDIALEMAMLLKCNLVSELHIARKQYLDGSIPAGFQRTTILGVDGWIPFLNRKIRIRQLAMEEDSCREMKDSGHDRVYITDRLGMPLIETVTEPEMKTPWETAAVAQVIRRLARATGKVRTGVGAARQDVNVSVRGGRRCEIKGVSSIRRIPLLVHNEAFRQANLLEIRGVMRRRGITPDSLSSKEIDVTGRLKGTVFEPIARAIGEGKRVYGVLLRGCEDLLKHSLGPGRSFLSEISDRVRVIACIDSQPNVITSDLPDATLSPAQWTRVRKSLGAGSGDAVVLVWGAPEDALTGACEISIRMREAAEGVPEETRQALSDGTTGFERILPGPNRMYPDTDLPPIPVEDRRLAKISAVLPEMPWAREKRYLKDGLTRELARILSITPICRLYDAVGVKPRKARALLAWVLIGQLRALKRKGLHPAGLDDRFLHEIFSLFAQGRLMRGGLLRLIEEFLKGDRSGPAKMIERLKLKPAGKREIAAALAAAVKAGHGRRFADKGRRLRFTMGRFMYRLGDRVDGAAARKLVAAGLKKRQGAAG